MNTVSFPSLANAEIIEVELIPLTGDTQPVRLLVDSGFTGTSSLVLPQDFAELIRADLTEAESSGALQGFQQRGWVSSLVHGMSSHQTVIAIFTDCSVLSLPENVVGMVGLTFLRHFSQWGAARSKSGWQFSLLSKQVSEPKSDVALRRRAGDVSKRQAAFVPVKELRSPHRQRCP